MPAATFGATITRVLDELDRTDLTAQASNAILSAIKHYQPSVFPFAEQRATLALTEGQEYFSVPDDFLYEHLLSVKESPASSHTLTQRDNETLELWAVPNLSGGIPTDYALYQQQIRLYPVPNDDYTLTFSYVRKLETLTLDGDQNAWLDQVEELIRNRAEWDLTFRVIRNYEAAGQLKAAERESLQQAISWRNKYMGAGTVKAYGFR